MKYLLKQKEADEIKTKYKNTYFVEKTGLSESYVSLIVNRRRALPKNTAYIFTKMIDSELEINDLFEKVD